MTNRPRGSELATLHLTAITQLYTFSRMMSVCTFSKQIKKENVFWDLESWASHSTRTASDSVTVWMNGNISGVSFTEQTAANAEGLLAVLTPSHGCADNRQIVKPNDLKAPRIESEGSGSIRSNPLLRPRDVASTPPS